MTPLIQLQNIKKSFGSNNVLDGVTLDIRKKTSMGILGGSGTGKSVLIKSILGIIKIDSGKILYKGVDMSKFNRGQRREFFADIGMLFQGAALFDSLCVWRNIAFSLVEHQNMRPKDAKKIAQEKLERVGLDAKIMDLSPSELSGGMQKRVGLARAIATNAKILFFDEPTTGLDPIMSNVINNLISELVKDMGVTAISITHDMNSVRKIATDIAMLKDSKIIWQGNIAEMENSGNNYVHTFVHATSN